MGLKAPQLTKVGGILCKKISKLSQISSHEIQKMARGKLGVLVNFINLQYKVCKIAHLGLFKVNLEFRVSGVTWKMKYQFVLETGN